jgi:hypothetical protein
MESINPSKKQLILIKFCNGFPLCMNVSRLFIRIKDTSNFNKMLRYLDLLEENAKALGTNVFDRFLRFLGDHPIVGDVCSVEDQLLTELSSERNELVIDGYLAVETSILVEIEFAGQGRTDAERKEIAAQITSRLQVYKEVGEQISPFAVASAVFQWCML